MNSEMNKLPFSLIAEQSLLGAILVDPDSINKVAQLISPDDFYLTEHRGIYSAMRELFLVSKEIDPVTLIDMLETKGIYDKSGGTDYIRTIADTVPSALNIIDYANIVKEKSLLRRLIEISSEISAAAYRGEDSAKDIMSFAEGKIYELMQGRTDKNFKHIRSVVQDVFGNLKVLATEGTTSLGTRTGFSDLDNVLVGMGKGDFILVGARPGMGKTAFVLNIATNVAKQTKKAVCIFSLEMSAEQLVTRVLSSEAMIDSYALRTGKLDSKQWESIAAAAASLVGTDILIDDTSGITVSSMKSKLRQVKNLGLIVVDYLGLMQSDRKIDNKVQEIADISRSLKIMAKDLGVPVLCCAQLNRSADKRAGDNKPVLSDLRDSGAIEQDADVVIFLYRKEYYDKEGVPSADENNIAEVIIAKNRHGAVKDVKVGWIGKYTKFIGIPSEKEVGQPR